MADHAKSPRCPNCRKPMKAAYIIPKMKRYPTIQSFKCRDCDELLIEAKMDE